MTAEKLIEYYNSTSMNKRLLGFSDDDLRLLFFKIPNGDFKLALSKIIEIAEGLIVNFEEDMDAYYFFIKEYVFKHCSEIFQVPSGIKLLGYNSTFTNLFYYLAGKESLMGIANYINSKPLEYFNPKNFMKNEEKVISEYPTMIHFFDAFKTENKVVVTKDEYLLNTYNYSTEKNSRKLRDFQFETLNNKCQNKNLIRKDTDLDVIITPPVFNAFMYEELCEGHLYAAKVINADGYHIREVICKDEQEKEVLIEQVLKAYPFSYFAYSGDDKDLIGIITKYGFVKVKSEYIRPDLENIDYPYYPSQISKFRPEIVYTKSDISNKEFLYNDALYDTYLDISCMPFENVLKCKCEDEESKIVGVNVKQFYVVSGCKYIIYQNYCSKRNHYECFDAETGEISSLIIEQDDCNKGLQKIDDISYARMHSIETGCIITCYNKPCFVPCLTYRENCMYLPHNVPEDALAHIGFNVITQTVIVYNNSMPEDEVKSLLNETGFGDNIRFVNTMEDEYCDRYSKGVISKTENIWSDNLKKLDSAYRLVFNRPYVLVNELPVPALGGWAVSGDPFKYKILTEYLKSHEEGFNLLYIFTPKEFEKMNIDTLMSKLGKKIENIHIVIEKTF